MTARMLRAVTVLAVLLVAGVAAVVSYSHMAELGREAGEGRLALLLPLSVDGLVVAASMVLLARRRAGLPGGWLPWVALLAGVGASLAANVAAAEPTATARVVAAWPAVAFAVAFELLLSQRRPVGARVGVDSPTAGDQVRDERLPGDGRAEVPERETASPACHPVGDGSGEAGDQAGARVGDGDPLAARTAELVDAARVEGRPVGRRTVARELGITEHEARRLLAATNGAPEGGGRR